MGDCEPERVLIALSVGLLLLSALGCAISWAAALRIVRASHAAMREVNALRASYRTHPVEWREAPGRDSTPRA